MFLYILHYKIREFLQNLTPYTFGSNMVRTHTHLNCEHLLQASPLFEFGSRRERCPLVLFVG